VLSKFVTSKSKAGYPLFNGAIEVFLVKSKIGYPFFNGVLEVLLVFIIFFKERDYLKK